MHWDTSKQDNNSTVEGTGHVRSVRYEQALLPPCLTIRVLSHSNCQRSTHPRKIIWRKRSLMNSGRVGLGVRGTSVQVKLEPQNIQLNNWNEEIYSHGHFFSPACVSCVWPSLAGENLGLMMVGPEHPELEPTEGRRGVELRMGVRRRSCWGDRGLPIGVGRVDPRTVLKVWIGIV